MKRIGILTSGGDAPGMNAAVRSATRSALAAGISVTGIRDGFQGLIDSRFSELNSRSVGGIINRGGTILGTARSDEFRTKVGRAKAFETLSRESIDGLVIIGGDGSFQGAHLLTAEYQIPTVGVPGTIDNDIAGTDFSIGFDTAINTALEGIDRVRDTASAHHRLFIIEVMGHSSGFIALYAGLAGGAEEVLIPETESDLKLTADRINAGKERGKQSAIVIVAEGDDTGDTAKVLKYMEENTSFEVRVVRLGHIQRGGSPTAMDRVLAIRLGAAAVEELTKGSTDIMVGLLANKVKASPLSWAWTKKNPLDLDMYTLLARVAV